MEDIGRAGGMNAVIKEISRRDNGMLHLENLTVSGETLGERVGLSEIKDESVIH